MEKKGNHYGILPLVIHFSSMISKEEISRQFRVLQDEICNSLEIEDRNSTFQEDVWDRKEGGGGISRILENGNLIEKGGVNFSAVFGNTPDNIKASFGHEKRNFMLLAFQLCYTLKILMFQSYT